MSQKTQRKAPRSHESLCIECDDLSTQQLQLMCGALDEHLSLIENQYGVAVRRRGSSFWVEGSAAQAEKARYCLTQLSQKATAHRVDAHVLRASIFEPQRSVESLRNQRCVAKHASQQKYQEMIQAHPITFGIGPAGTGKTYLAVAAAVQAYQQGSIEKIILTRPAVEAGERLGFLPGDLQQKIDPYLRPLFDAMNDLMGAETTQALLAKQALEVAPLAFMRGRTLSKAFIILDEAQNTTITQMKLFLTRLGENSKMVITGDISQIDLPYPTDSGLRHAISALRVIPQIGFHFFSNSDIVRHPLIGKILEAYGDA